MMFRFNDEKKNNRKNATNILKHISKAQNKFPFVNTYCSETHSGNFRPQLATRASRHFPTRFPADCRQFAAAYTTNNVLQASQG